MSKEYKYSDPLERGYEKLKLSRKDNNRILPRRKIKHFGLFAKVKAFYREDRVRLEYYNTLLAKILITLMFPYYVIIGELSQILEEYRDLYQQRKYNAFSEDVILRGSRLGNISETFLELEQIYIRQKKN